MTPGLSRRRLLTFLFGGSIASVWPGASRAATGFSLPNADDNRRFSVLYDGRKIGTHAISYSKLGNRTRVNTDIELEVKALFFTVLSYSHTSEEVWQDGCLTSLQSETVEDGERVSLKGKATPRGFRIVSDGGPYTAPSDTLTSNSLWTPDVLLQETVVDAQYGGVIGVSARKVGQENISVAGDLVSATRYRFITPYLAGSIWYDGSDRWVRGDFERDGSDILYRLEG